MDFFEKTIHSEVIFQGRILDLRVDTVVLPNGVKSKRELVNHKAAVGVLAVKDDCIWFVKQYRKAVETAMIEIPAGLMETGEDPYESATRELQEEIGLKPLDLSVMGEMITSAGFSNEKITLFIATEFIESKKAADDDEFLNIIKIPIPTAEMLYRSGRFTDAKTVCALGYFFNNL